MTQTNKFTPPAFLSNGTTAGPIRILLVAIVLVPVATEVVALYRQREPGVVHLSVMAILMVAIAIAVTRALRRIEEQYRKAREWTQLQINRMPVACFVIDPDLNIRSWNPSAERIFGYAAGDILGRPATTLLAKTATPLPSGSADHRTQQVVTKDGRTIICRWQNTPLVDKNGTAECILAMVQDVTEEQEAQTALRRSQQRHRELIDKLPHYVFSVDLQEHYISVNRAVCELYGRAENEIIGKTPLELGMPAHVAEAWLQQKEIVRAAGETRVFDSMMAKPGGGTRYIRAILSPLRNDAGAIVGLTGISIDMTDLRTAEATAHRLLGAIEQLDEVMFTTDRHGVITFVNPAFERIYGYTREEVIGKTPRLLKSGDFAPATYNQFWSELLAGRSVRMQFRNRAKDGSLVEIVSSASPVVSENGAITGFIAVQQDVTEQKRVAEERRTLDERVARLDKIEALGTLAGGMAHDFNNILAIIMTHANLVERRIGDAERINSAIATIKKAVQRGAGLSRQILTFARRAEMKREDVHTASLVMELGSMLSETFPRNVKLTLRLDADLPLISADSGQLHQALLNLCVNARDAMPSGGELTIETQLMTGVMVRTPFADTQPDFVCITVSDTGTGIDEETRRRLFEPFFTTKPKGEGTGLGLALVYGVVKSHGGLVDVESQPGCGTRFRLYFPIGPVKGTGAETADRVTTYNGAESLLVIEDETALLESLTTQLRLRGYHVAAASDGPEAIDVFRRMPSPPDAVIMDLGMPNMSAVDLVKTLRANAPLMPIVAMTGYVDPEVHASVIAAGVRDVVQKPFEINDLLRSLRHVLH